MVYLFDSSAIYAMAKAGKTQLLISHRTCSLAPYELGNALLTERHRTKTISEYEQVYLLGAISAALSFMLITGVKGGEQKIIDLSIRYDLSFYDASYVYLAKALGLTLVTEDGKLARKIKGYVETTAANQLT